MNHISNPFRYMMRQRYPSIGSVYKAWFGKKYLIWKCKALHQSVNMIAKELDQRLRLGLKEADPFQKAVEHIRRARVTIFEVEAVVQSDNPVDLLISEYNLLKAGVDDPQCLNTVSFPSIPQWMPQSARDEFQQYVAKLATANKKAGKKPVKPKSGGKGLKKKVSRKSPVKTSSGHRRPFTKKKGSGKRKAA